MNTPNLLALIEPINWGYFDIMYLYFQFLMRVLITNNFLFSPVVLRENCIYFVHDKEQRKKIAKK